MTVARARETAAPAAGREIEIRGRRRRVVLFATTISLMLLMVASAGRVLIVSRSVSAPDAILMLAGHEWERLPAAVRLAERYPAASILLTQPWEYDEWSCYRCPERPQMLEDAGVRVERIVVISEPVNNTITEAQAALDYVRRTPTGGLLVVTSPYHTRRALAVFLKVFAATSVKIGVEPALGESDVTPAFWWAHGHDAWYVTYEWAALIKYAFRYGVFPIV